MKQTINCRGKMLSFNTPKTMGVINLSKESFYTESSFSNYQDVFKRCEKMILEGVDIIDIGAQSTKPNSIILPEEEELKRVMPILEKITQDFPNQIFSIDTFYSNVAEYAVGKGFHIVNDISGGIDKNMFNLVATLKVPYICTYNQRKRNEKKQKSPMDLIISGDNYFQELIKQLKDRGIVDVLLDVGIGFGKSIEENFLLIDNLNFFKKFGLPLLVGLSRKSFIYKTLQINSEEALNGTSAMNMIALYNGANILRVHDVKEAKQCVELYQSLKKIRLC